VLTNLLHVSQQVWWLEATLGTTCALVNTSSTRSRKYLSNPSKHWLEYARLFELSIYVILYNSILKGINFSINIIFPFISLTTIFSYEWQICKVLIISNKDVQYLLILGNKINQHNGHIIQSWRYTPQLQVSL